MQFTDINSIQIQVKNNVTYRGNVRVSDGVDKLLPAFLRPVYYKRKHQGEVRDDRWVDDDSIFQRPLQDIDFIVDGRGVGDVQVRQIGNLKSKIRCEKANI